MLLTNMEKNFIMFCTNKISGTGVTVAHPHRVGASEILRRIPKAMHTDVR